MSVNGAKTVVIALFTHTSIGPSSDSTWCAASATCSAFATSTHSRAARVPRRVTSFTVASSPSVPRASTPTSHPLAANRSTAARPTPAVAPVTTTTLTDSLLDLLQCRVCELQPVARRDRGQCRGNEASGPRGEHESEREARRDPLPDAEGAREKLTDSVAKAGAADLLVDLALTGGLLETGERSAHDRSDRVLRDQPAQPVRRDGHERD